MWLDDADAVELGLPPDAWLGFVTVRAGTTYTYVVNEIRRRPQWCATT